MNVSDDKPKQEHIELYSRRETFGPVEPQVPLLIITTSMIKIQGYNQNLEFLNLYDRIISPPILQKSMTCITFN